MIDKLHPHIASALADVADGATVTISGFGGAGQPAELIDGLIDGLIAQGAGGLVFVNNNAGNGETGLAALLKAGRVRKIICSFPRQADSHVFDALYRAGKTRNFGPVMATAARVTVAQVHEVLPLGALDPEHIVTPGIHVRRLVQVPRAGSLQHAA